MKYLKNTLIISSYLLLVAIFFASGFAIGKINIQKNEPTVSEPVFETQETVNESEKNSKYKVIVSNGQLLLYKCAENGNELIADENISESVFPKDDIDELKKGIVFNNIQEAQKMFENFVS